MRYGWGPTATIVRLLVLPDQQFTLGDARKGVSSISPVWRVETRKRSLRRIPARPNAIRARSSAVTSATGSKPAGALVCVLLQPEQDPVSHIWVWASALPAMRSTPAPAEA